MRDRLFKAFFYLFAAGLILGITIPVANMLLSVSPDFLRYIKSDPKIIRSVLFTLESSFFATVAGVLLGIPCAYVLARSDFWAKGIIEALVDIPVMIPHSAAGIALLSVYGSRFFLGRFFSLFGVKFVDTAYGVVLGMFFVSFSYLVNSSKEGFKKVDRRLEYVAMNLGASRTEAFFRVVLPCSVSDIISGMIMMWARGLSEFGAVVILAYHPMTAPVMIYERFTSFGLKYSKPIAVVMIYISLAVFFLLRLIQHRIKKNSLR